MLSDMKTRSVSRRGSFARLGWSVKEIERALGVSRSSVSVWVRDIELDDEQRRRLVAKVTEGRLRSGRTKGDGGTRACGGAIRRTVERRHASSRPDYAAGCMLYWAEGGKGRNAVKMSNSDPALLAYFAAFLRVHFEVAGRVGSAIHCNLFADHLDRQHEIEAFWLTTLESPSDVPAQVDRQHATRSTARRSGEQAARTEHAASPCTARGSCRPSTARSRNTAASSDRNGWISRGYRKAPISAAPPTISAAAVRSLAPMRSLRPRKIQASSTVHNDSVA